MEFIQPRFTGSIGVSGSINLTGSLYGVVSGSLFGTASYALQSKAAFPYTGSALITGTLFVSDEFYLGEVSGSTPFTASQVISSSAADTRLSGSFSGSFYGAFVGVDTSLISSGSASAAIRYDVSGSSSLQINTEVSVTGSVLVTGSIHMWQSASVSGTNIFGTASYANTASYFEGYVDQGITLSFLTASTTWSAVHGLNTLFPMITVWDSSSFEVIQPDAVESKGINTSEIRFTSPRTGYVNIAKAGAPLYQVSPFYTASFALTASFVSGGVNVQDSISSSWSATASLAETASFATYALNAQGAGSPVIISGSAPSGSPSGALWYNSDELALYVRYEDASGSNWLPSYNALLANAESASYADTAVFSQTAESASYATTAVIAQGFTSSFLSQSTVIINHNLGTKSLIVAVYDDLDYQVIPSSVQLSDNNNAIVQFYSVESGYVVIK